MSNEWAVTEDDLNGGGGGSSAKPRGVYTGEISRAQAKKDKNGKPYLAFGISVTKGKFSKQLIFENYLPLSKDSNKFQLARRNSFFKAVDLEPGSIPPGAPGGPDPSVLNGTIVDIRVEHEYEDVPDEQYSVVTSDWNKSRWVEEKWQDRLDGNGNLVKNQAGEALDEPIEPRESLSFYALSDDFVGLGSGDSGGDGFVPEAADTDGWG